MKMNFLKKIATSLLILCFAAGSFNLSACGKNKVKYDPDNFLPEGTEENPYQIVKETVTLKIFVPKVASHPHYNEMVMFKELSRLTNLSFDFIEADSGAVTTLRSTTWEDKNNLPDLFLYGNPVSEQVIYSRMGAIVPMNDPELVVQGVEVGSLLDYMPNYSQRLEENFGISEAAGGSAVKLATMPDGKMYSVICSDDIPHNLTFKTFINTAWIDNLNKYESEFVSDPLTKDPQTIDEYLRILRAFKKYDADGDGDPDNEIPVSAANLQYLRNFIMAAYGYVTNTLELSQDGSGFTYVPSTAAFREYLKTVRTMYKEGLIDNGTFEMKDANVVAKGYSGCLGSFCGAGAYLIVGTDKEADYDTIGPLTSDFYQGPKLQWSLPMLEATGSMIPTGTPYVREIARLLDILYTDFGAKLQTYGIEGENFVWLDEEHTSWKFNIPDGFTGSDEEYRANICPQPILGAHLYLVNDFMSKDSNPVVQKIIAQSERYVDYLKSYSVEHVKLLAEEYTDLVPITSNLDTYIRSMEYNFIAGEKDPAKDSDWEAFQSALSGYNYQKLVTSYNAGMDK